MDSGWFATTLRRQHSCSLGLQATSRHLHVSILFTGRVTTVLLTTRYLYTFSGFEFPLFIASMHMAPRTLNSLGSCRLRNFGPRVSGVICKGLAATALQLGGRFSLFTMKTMTSFRDHNPGIRDVRVELPGSRFRTARSCRFHLLEVLYSD